MSHPQSCRATNLTLCSLPPCLPEGARGDAHCHARVCESVSGGEGGAGAGRARARDLEKKCRAWGIRRGCISTGRAPSSMHPLAVDQPQQTIYRICDGCQLGGQRHEIVTYMCIYEIMTYTCIYEIVTYTSLYPLFHLEACHAGAALPLC